MVLTNLVKLWLPLILSAVTAALSQADQATTMSMIEECFDSCDLRNCATVDPTDCRGSIVKDNCGCCPVCAEEMTSEDSIQEISNTTDVNVREDKEEKACSHFTCPRFEVCMLNIQNLPVCRCPSGPMCKSKQRTPVCGENNVTYKNVCFLKAEECQKRQNIRVLRKGACEGDGGPGRKGERRGEKKLQRLVKKRAKLEARIERMKTDAPPVLNPPVQDQVTGGADKVDRVQRRKEMKRVEKAASRAEKRQQKQEARNLKKEEKKAERQRLRQRSQQELDATFAAQEETELERQQADQPAPADPVSLTEKRAQRKFLRQQEKKQDRKEKRLQRKVEEKSAKRAARRTLRRESLASDLQDGAI